MNRSDIVDELVLLGTEPEDARLAVDRVLNAISRSLACGERVTIRNFGKFEPRQRRPVVRKNPVSGQEIPVPEKVSIGFVAAPALKERVNNGRGHR
jgi:integration host factor subunit beta